MCSRVTRHEFIYMFQPNALPMPWLSSGWQENFVTHTHSKWYIQVNKWINKGGMWCRYSCTPRGHQGVIHYRPGFIEPSVKEGKRKQRGNDISNIQDTSSVLKTWVLWLVWQAVRCWTYLSLLISVNNTKMQIMVLNTEVVCGSIQCNCGG